MCVAQGDLVAATHHVAEMGFFGFESFWLFWFQGWGVTEFRRLGLSWFQEPGGMPLGCHRSLSVSTRHGWPTCSPHATVVAATARHAV